MSSLVSDDLDAQVWELDAVIVVIDIVVDLLRGLSVLALQKDRRERVLTVPKALHVILSHCGVCMMVM